MAAKLPRSQSSGLFLVGLYEGPSRVYAHKPRSTHELKEAIRSEARQILPHMIDSAVSHLDTVRLPMVLRRKGSHLEHLL